jgi:hypothetical protein
MNVEIGAEAALFPEKEYINGIFVAVLLKKGRERWLRERVHIAEKGKRKVAKERKGKIP